MTRAVVALVTLAGLGVACTPRAEAPRATTPPSTPPASTATADPGAPSPVETAAPSPGATAPAAVPGAPASPAPPASEGPTPGAAMGREAPPSPACPADMILVEGEYCSEVEHTCLKSWFDASNKKDVCEEFAPKARCIGTRTRKRYCVDRFAWPNQRGVRAEVMNNFYQAQVKCAAVGKRMCTESEWTLACEGPEMKPFPYGWRRDPTKCNGDQPWDGPRMKKVAQRDPKELARLWRGVPNGAQPECVSDFGVPDLPGNTDDVVASETFSDGWKGKYDSVHTGGPWYKGTRNQCRPKIYTHDEGFYYYFLGFRCCAEPDGQPTDPRTPKQRKDGWKFSRVESLARFGVDAMKEKIEQKKSGTCSCKEKDILCKTMCGTLLGPDATDVDLKAPRD